MLTVLEMPVAPCSAMTPGMKVAISSKLLNPWACRYSPGMTEMEIGTSSRDCSRFWAVTMISSKKTRPSRLSWAPAGGTKKTPSHSAMPN